ncbi:Kelch-like protein 12 [Bienertia sinuspersici]
MGAGRKTETVVVQNKPPPQQTSNQHPWSARNMRKKDLAAVIFGCKHSTFNECVFKQFDRKLHGIYEATSHGQMHINQYAWTLDGEDVTAFPAQVRVKVRMQCRPLSEEQFKPILADNYSNYEPHHFWFELDQAQTDKLISLFSASPVGQSVTVPRNTAKWGTLFSQAVAPMVRQEDVCLGNGTSKQEMVALADQAIVKKQGSDVSFEGKTWSSLFKAQSQVDSASKKDDDSSSEGFSNMSEDEALLMSGMLSDNEVHTMSEVACFDDAPIASEVMCFTEEISSLLSTNQQDGLYKLIQAIEEMKASQLVQTRKIQTLEQDLFEAKKRIQELENFHQGLGQSLLQQSTAKLKELQLKRCSQDSYRSILLVGGFSGSSWLRDLDMYMPSEDVMQSLKPMSSVRSYASAVKHKDALYVLGGGSGSSWFDTVESYNLKKHQWMSCPPLNRKKGSLAGVSFCDKIYAVGGGNASDCFSEMEMLDLDIGKWVMTRSMIEKRFAPAAAQVNGALYVVGGYNGCEYLKSMERFDPREYSWTRLKSMGTNRGCHSLTVMNEKLYAIGGYDGTQMVPTVEVFEPRVGSWMMLEPMKYARGYMGSVTLGNTIYVIGGMQENGEILDTVECYSEGKGWKLADLKAFGKRCFFSAVAV